jgi:PTS system nitrogen regulatory IIA component
MRHGLSSLRALFGRRDEPAPQAARAETTRNVMMRVTLDAEHATPVRRALSRDCAGQPWTIRVTPLSGTGRVRLALYLPMAAVRGAMRRVAALAPTAEVGQLLEVPEAPTHAWHDLLHPDKAPGDPGRAERQAAIANGDTLAALISEDRVLLGVDAKDRDALFVYLGRLVQQHCGLPALKVADDLAAREALGSTGLGQGVAVPHAPIHGTRKAMVVYLRPLAPIAFDSPDGLPVTDVVALFVPEWANATHLHLLADVAERFCDQRFRARLHGCADARAVCELFKSGERAQ